MIHRMWTYWTRDDPRYRSARRIQVMTMGPVFTVAVVFFAFERAWFIAGVCGVAVAFCVWRWRALR